jgi:hypothetical protein
MNIEMDRKRNYKMEPDSKIFNNIIDKTRLNV